MFFFQSFWKKRHFNGLVVTVKIIHFPGDQYAYRVGYSCETALVKFMYDLLWGMKTKKIRLSWPLESYELRDKHQR